MRAFTAVEQVITSLSQAPSKSSGSPVGEGLRVSQTTTNSPQRFQVTGTLCFISQTLPVSALVDSGAEESFMDIQLARQLNLLFVPLESKLVVRSLNGLHLAQVSHRTSPIKLVLAGNHQESISFHLIDHSEPLLVLGYPWLRKHNPRIDWARAEVNSWSPLCLSHCLRSALTPDAPSPPSPPEPVDVSLVLSVYHDLAQVFSKKKALSLPPHRPYDCSIELLSRAPLPRSRLYNLSRPERSAMEDYIRESLTAGIICPSSSPVGAGFFFVSKKDGSLRPCIDFRGLNSITVKNRYPLPLLSSAFLPLHGATVFSKLHLWNAYHLVRVREGDEWKTAFNTPPGHFEYLVMPFGLTNAPAVFQNLMNDVLRDFIDRFVFVYLVCT